MYCENCGIELEEDDKFCFECGYPAEKDEEYELFKRAAAPVLTDAFKPIEQTSIENTKKENLQQAEAEAVSKDPVESGKDVKQPEQEKAAAGIHTEVQKATSYSRTEQDAVESSGIGEKPHDPKPDPFSGEAMAAAFPQAVKVTENQNPELKPETPEKKRLNAWVIVLIIVGAVILAAAIICLMTFNVFGAGTGL